jgi:RNA polymerase sigma-70 factor (ECF subfamily)
MADSEWLRKALDDFETPLIRYARSLLGDLDRARDVVQETFLRLCQQDRSSVEDHLPQWLFRVCRNLAIDLFRREVPMQTVDGMTAETLPAQSPDPADQMETTERLDRVKRLLAGLSSNQQEVVRLKFQDGLSYREISDITGLSVSNVGFLIHTAVKTIRSRTLAQEAAQNRMRRVK